MVSVPSETRLKAILFTGFAVSECEERWVPALEQRGLVVQKIVDVDLVRARENLRPYDIALFMYERASHSQHAAIRNACRSQGVRMQLIRTAITTWPADFREREKVVEMQLQPTVTDADLDNFLKEFQARWKQGERYFDMVEPLARYWRVGNLQRPDQLVDYIRTLVTKERAPEWFRSWYALEVTAPRKLVDITPAPPAPPAPPVVAAPPAVVAAPVEAKKPLSTSLGEALAAKGIAIAAALDSGVDWNLRTPPKATISNENFELACVEYATRWSDGEKKNSMVKSMERLWSHGALTNWGQLYAFFWTRVKRGRCPAWFRTWWLKDRVTRTAPNRNIFGVMAARSTRSSKVNEASQQGVGEVDSGRWRLRVRRESLEEACKKYVELWEADVALSEMRAKLARYVPIKPDTPSPNAYLQAAFKSVAFSDVSPKWFTEWWLTKRPTVSRRRSEQGSDNLARASEEKRRVHDKDVAEACATYREMLEAGFSIQQIREKLAPIVRINAAEGSSPNAQFSEVMRILVVRKRAPKDFIAWWTNVRPKLSRSTMGPRVADAPAPVAAPAPPGRVTAAQALALRKQGFTPRECIAKLNISRGNYFKLVNGSLKDCCHYTRATLPAVDVEAPSKHPNLTAPEHTNGVSVPRVLASSYGAAPPPASGKPTLHEVIAAIEILTRAGRIDQTQAFRWIADYASAP